MFYAWGHGIPLLDKEMGIIALAYSTFSRIYCSLFAVMAALEIER